MKEASFYKREGDLVKCGLCRHNCLIQKDKLGLCGVRKNIDNKLFSVNYARPTSVNVDPIEKKPLYHFLPFTNVFSIGSFGCNFKCDFCQNWDISQFSLEVKEVKPEQVIKDIQTPSIAYTYNEPTVFYEYAHDIAKLADKKGIKNIFVTNGYIEEKPLLKIAPILHAANIDFKAYSNDFYQKVCKADFDKYLDSLSVWSKTKIWTEFTNLLIPGENDKPDMIKQMCEFIKDKFGSETPIHFSAYYPTYKRKTPPTEQDSLHKAYDIAKDVGMKYIYLGNILTDQINTYCYNCDELIVDRSAQKVNITKSQTCPSCGKKQWFVTE